MHVLPLPLNHNAQLVFPKAWTAMVYTAVTPVARPAHAPPGTLRARFPKATPCLPTVRAWTPTRAGKLTTEDRRARYTSLYDYVAARIGCTPAVHDGTSLVRNSAFTHLFDMAQTPEELERVTDLFPVFADGRRQLGEQQVEKFVREYHILYSLHRRII